MQPCIKFCHPNEADALGQLRVLKLKSGENKKRLNTLHVYWCHDCIAWHVGHDRYRSKRKMRSA